MASYSHNADELTVLMTANDLPSPCVASASSVRTGYEAYRAFNHSVTVLNDNWMTDQLGVTGWLKIDLGSGNEVAVNGYSVSVNRGTSYASACPKNWTLDGSNNDIDWVTLDTQTNQTTWADLEMRTFSFTNTTAYRYYRLNITANNGDANWLLVGELELTSPEAVTTEIDASIVIAPQFFGTMMKGAAGDIYASIVIDPQLSGTVRVESAISANITISPSLSGTINKELTPELEGSIVISPQMSGTISMSIVSDGAITLPMFTLLAIGIGENLGCAELYLPIITLSAEGFDHPTGEGNLILPMLSLLGIGQINELGEASINLPTLRLSATGEAGVLGYGAIALPMFTLFSEVLIGEVGEASLTIPIFRISGEGVDGAVGSGAITIPILTLSTLGYSSIEGTANLTLPMLKLFAEILTGSADFLSMVMNIKNRALTLYANYPFNSLCRFNGKHLGMTENRIYDLDSGETDDGTLIDWNFRTGYVDLDQKIKLKLKQAWFSYKSNGDLIVTVVQPDGTKYEYDLTGYEITEDGLRVKFGKGLGAKYVALDVKNVDGSSITLDTLRLNFDKFKKER